MQDVKPFKVTVNTAKPAITSAGPAKPPTSPRSSVSSGASVRQSVVIKPSANNTTEPEELGLLDQFEPVAEPYPEVPAEPVPVLAESSTKIIRSGGIMSRFRRSSNKGNSEPEAAQDESGTYDTKQAESSASDNASSATQSSQPAETGVSPSTSQVVKRTPVVLDIISSKPAQKAMPASALTTEAGRDSNLETKTELSISVKSDAKVEKKVELDDSYWDKAVEASSASSYEHEDLDKAFLVSDSTDESEDNYLDQIEENSGATPTEADWSDVPEKVEAPETEAVKEVKVEEKPVDSAKPEVKEIPKSTPTPEPAPAVSPVAQVTASNSDSPSGYLFPKPQTNSGAGEDPLEEAAQAAQDSLQDPKIYDTKHYHVPIAKTNSTSGKSKALIALGFILGAAAIAAVLHVMGVIKLPVNF
jgi:hypothetical protein